MRITLSRGNEAESNDHQGSFIEGLFKSFRKNLNVLIFIFFLFLSFFTIYSLIWGWFGPPLRSPAISQGLEGDRIVAIGLDSDSDGLPDLIENAPKGTLVVNEDGIKIGIGTGTNPFSADSDNDFFDDSLETSLGTDPNGWFFPGFIWILWSSLFLYFLYWRFIEKRDLVKTYKKNEKAITGKLTQSKKEYRTANELFKNDLTIKRTNRFRKVVRSGFTRKRDIEDFRAIHDKKNKLLRFTYFSLFLAFIFIGVGVIKLSSPDPRNSVSLSESADYISGFGYTIIGFGFLIISGLLYRNSRKIMKGAKKAKDEFYESNYNYN